MLLCGTLSAQSRLNQDLLLDIKGWPFPVSFLDPSPPLWLGYDPVFGRLACPPLTRLNLKEKKSEALILKSVQAGPDKTGTWLWTYELRSGIFSWSGKLIQTEDLATFIRNNIAQVLEDRGAGLWELPPYSITTEQDTVSVHWQTKPKFGPYLFNGVPFWVKSSSKKPSFECVGRFSPTQESLSPTKPTADSSPSSKIALHFNKAYAINATPAPAKKPLLVEFILAGDSVYSPTSLPPLVKDKAPCPYPVDLEMMSVIVWNTQRKSLQSAKTRQLMTQLSPRRALLVGGASLLGEVPSSLIPKGHPGFDEKVLVRKFDSRAYRNSKEKTPPLTLSSIRQEMGLLEKVLIDSYRSSGLDISFVAKPKDLSQIDGLISGLIIPWPEASFLKQFHSKSNEQKEGDSFSLSLLDKELDKVLEAYAESLSFEKPQFELLKKIHRTLYEAEPITVLLQHKACLKIQGLPLKEPVKTNNPDWFKILID